MKIYIIATFSCFYVRDNNVSNMTLNCNNYFIFHKTNNLILLKNMILMFILYVLVLKRIIFFKAIILISKCVSFESVKFVSYSCTI